MYRKTGMLLYNGKIYLWHKQQIKIIFPLQCNSTNLAQGFCWCNKSHKSFYPLLVQGLFLSLYQMHMRIYGMLDSIFLLTTWIYWDQTFQICKSNATFISPLDIHMYSLYIQRCFYFWKKWYKTTIITIIAKQNMCLCLCSRSRKFNNYLDLSWVYLNAWSKNKMSQNYALSHHHMTFFMTTAQLGGYTLCKNLFNIMKILTKIIAIRGKIIHI